uniref:Uncharacterized protein n=1 Tax=Spongospora subterranea TaxID=70186 RepID=A0A0H5QJ05_9EUKA|eukprot:CRZ01988.1 hypothetical protein [Spongospora subterranea]
MKFLMIVKGLQSATAAHGCPICTKCKKMPKAKNRRVVPPGGWQCACDDGIGTCLHWKGPGTPRSQVLSDEIVGNVSSNRPYEHFGFHQVAPIRSIDWGHIMLDPLHANLRFTDVIMGAIFESLRATVSLPVGSARSNLLKLLEEQMCCEFFRASGQRFTVYRKQQTNYDSGDVSFSSLWNSNRVKLFANLRLDNVTSIDDWPDMLAWQLICQDSVTYYKQISRPEPFGCEDDIDCIQVFSAIRY